MERPEVELGLMVEFDELFSLRERIRGIADEIRSRLFAGGLRDRLEPQVFDDELELRGTDGSRLLIRLDNYHLEITGAPSAVQVHLVAAVILNEAGVFRLTSVEAGFAATMQAGPDRPLSLVEHAFVPILPAEAGDALDRRFSLTWDWGNATTGYSLFASDTEDRELFVSFKAREGYMTLPELQSGDWMNEQAQRFDEALGRVLRHLGWKV